jgi:hypothetical protein
VSNEGTRIARVRRTPDVARNIRESGSSKLALAEESISHRAESWSCARNERLRAKKLDSEGEKVNVGDVRVWISDRFGREFVSQEAPNGIFRY